MMARRVYFQEIRTGAPIAVPVAQLKAMSKRGLERISRVNYERLRKNITVIPAKHVAVLPVVASPSPLKPPTWTLPANIVQQVLGGQRVQA